MRFVAFLPATLIALTAWSGDVLADCAYAYVDLLDRATSRHRVPFRAGCPLSQHRYGVARKNCVQVDARVGDEFRRGAHWIVAKGEVPRCLSNCPFQVGVGVLPSRQHARPEGHVTEIPSGYERTRVPEMSPGVANAVPGTANDRASGMPMAYDLWEARERVGAIAVERFAAGHSARCMMRGSVPRTIVLAVGSIDRPRKACGPIADGIGGQGQAVSV